MCVGGGGGGGLIILKSVFMSGGFLFEIHVLVNNFVCFDLLLEPSGNDLCLIFLLLLSL